MASATAAFHRQRAVNIGAASSACVSTARTLFECRYPAASASGKLWLVLSESTIASSVAAACSSKSNLRQKRLRSARPHAVDPAAKRRMNHELHAAGLIEKSLEHDGVERRQHAERGFGGMQIVDELGRGRCRNADFRLEPFERGRAVGTCFDFAAQPRNGVREFGAAGRRLAEPERYAGRLAARILDAHAPGFHTQDPV